MNTRDLSRQYHVRGKPIEITVQNNVQHMVTMPWWSTVPMALADIHHKGKTSNRKDSTYNYPTHVISVIAWSVYIISLRNKSIEETYNTVGQTRDFPKKHP